MSDNEMKTNNDATNYSGKRDDKDQPSTLSEDGATNSSTNSQTATTTATATKQMPTIDISQSLPSSNNTTQPDMLPTFPSSPPPPPTSPSSSSSSKFVINDTAPKWRFVNKAKKTEGYDSTAAGKIVKGLSAQELVSTYKAPTTKKVINQKNSIESSGDINDPNTANEDREQRKVGKIGKLDISGEHTEIEESYEVSPRKKKEQEVVEKKVPSANNEHDDEPKIDPEEESKVDTDIETAAPAVDNDEIINQVKKQEEEPAVAGEACPIPTTTPISISIEQPEEEIPKESLEEEEEEEKPSNNNKRRKWTLLLLLLLIIIAIATVVGVMISKKDKTNDDNIKVVEQQDIGITEQTSTAPTPEPGYCPSSSTLFSIQSNIINGGSSVQRQQQQGGLQQEVGQQQKTWILREACTNDVVMKCLPCSPNVASPSTTTASDTSSLFSDTATITTTTEAETVQSNLFNNNNNEPIPSPPSSSNTNTYSPTWLMNRNCIGNTNRPRPVTTDGERFRFNLLLWNDDLTEAAGESGAIFSGGGMCVDNDGRRYEFGLFDAVENFDNCASKCVNDTPRSLAKRDILRGYEYHCQDQTCRCLYDGGTLNDDNTDKFDSSKYENKKYVGTGEVSSVVINSGVYCGKLVGEDEDDNDDDGDGANDRPTTSPIGLPMNEQSEFQQVYNYDIVQKYKPGIDGVSGCIPDTNEYVLEVKQSNYIGECCGFAPESFTMSFDDNVVITSEESSNVVGKLYFPQDGFEACESNDPSMMPSHEPTGNPKQSPSQKPTSSPTLRPTNNPTLRPSSSPSQPTTARPTENPTTSNPTSPPTTGPPTQKPTCSDTYTDFNLCIALDMSGSVCNQGTGFECENCQPELVCNDVGLGLGTCCNNFLEVIEFTKSLVNSLSNIEVEQSYSLVGFGVDAEVATDGVLPEDILILLDEIVYTGGRTNHAAAIDACTSTFGIDDSRNLMLLITDGDPSEPRGSPQASAEMAAVTAKAAYDVFIIPVMIIPQFTTLVPEPLVYLSGISGDGTVFDVSDFDVLESLQERLLAKMSC